MNTTGLLALIGMGLMGFVRIIRTDRVQQALPASLKWDRLPVAWQFVLIFGLSIGGAVISAVSVGAPIAEAISAGFVAGATAMGLNHATIKIGQEMTARALDNNPGYTPSAARKAMSIALPIDRKLLNGHSIRSTIQGAFNGHDPKTEASQEAQGQTDQGQREGQG